MSDLFVKPFPSSFNAMSLRTLNVSVAIAIALFAACSGDNGKQSTSDLPITGKLQIDSVLLARIPSASEHSLLGVDAGFLSKESILIVESSSSTIRRFNANGEEGSPIGNKGRGPGEFVNLSWAGFDGQTIVAYDGSLRRLSYFDSDGRHMRDVPVSVPVRYSYVQPAGTFTDGSILLRGFAQATANRVGTFRGQGTLFRVAVDGGKTDSIGSYEDNEVARVATSNGGYRQSAPPLARTSFVFAWGDTVYVVDNNDRSVQKMMFGSVTRVYPDTRRDSIQVAEFDLLREKTWYTQGDTPAGELAKAFDAMPVPRILPSYGWGLDYQKSPATRTSSGQLWLTQYESTREGRPRWSVMDLVSGTSRIATASHGMRILDANDTLALVLLIDRDGVESVELRRVRSK